MAGSIILDIVLVVMAAFIIFKYTVAGFLKSILDFAKVIASVLLAILFRLPVANLICGLFMNEVINGWVYSSFAQLLAGVDPPVNFLRLNSETPQFFKNVLTNFGLDYDRFNDELYNLSEENIGYLTDELGGSISLMLSTIIAVIAIFVVAMIVLSLVVKLLNNITKISGLRAINRLLGLALGVVWAIVAIWAIGMGAQALINMLSPIFPEVVDQSIIDDSMVLGVLEKIGINFLVNELTTKLTI